MTKEAASRGRVATMFSTAVGSGAQRGLQGLLIFAVIAAASRQHDAVVVGLLGISATLALVATALADFGTTPMSLREFAQAMPSREEFRRLLLAKVAVAALVGLFIAIAALVFAGGAGRLTVASTMLSVPLAAATSTSTAWLIAQRRGGSLLIASLLGFAAGIAVIGVVLGAHAPGWMLALAFPAARIVEWVTQTAAIEFAAGAPTTERFGLKALVGCWPLAAQTALQVIYQRTSLLLTAALLSTVAAGRVAQGQSIYSLVAIGPSVLATVAFPDLVRARSRGDFGRTFRRLLALICVLVWPFAFALAIWTRPILHLAYGSSEPTTVAFLRWCAFSLLLSGPNSLTAFRFIAANRERLLAILSVVTTVSAVAFLSVGAWNWGVAGAGAAMFAAELATSFVFFVVASRRIE